MTGPVEVSRPRMLTRPLVLVFVSSFGFSTSFYLMLSVVPLYATSVGAGGKAPWWLKTANCLVVALQRAGLVIGQQNWDGSAHTSPGTSRPMCAVSRFSGKIEGAGPLLGDGLAETVAADGR
jgi:hypothetical protein